VSPLLEFLALRLICYDYISSDFRKTDSLTSITDELLKGYNRIKDATKIAKITEVTTRIHAAFHGESKSGNNSK
jgi:DNA-binding transcriptional regulator YiaG